MLRRLTELCQQAGTKLLELQGQEIILRRKSSGDLVTSADKASHEIIQKGLVSSFPGVPVILEEQCNIEPLPSTYIAGDELDGTHIYSHGHADWAVTLALVEDRKPKRGVIVQPGRGVLITAESGRGVEFNGRRISLSKTTNLADSVSSFELNANLTAATWMRTQRLVNQTFGGPLSQVGERQWMLAHMDRFPEFTIDPRKCD